MVGPGLTWEAPAGAGSGRHRRCDEVIGRAGMRAGIQAGIRAGAILLAGLIAATPAAAADRVTVFAAASMKTVLEAIGADFEAASGTEVVFSFAGSGALARQLEQGAPADVFVSADEAWMDHAVETGAVDPSSRRTIAANALVLVTPADATVTVDLSAAPDLAGLVGDGRLAIGEPRSVPAGAYAKAALESLGLWAAVEGRLAPVENVRVVLALVASGEAPFGVVYATDARAEPKVRVAGRFPAGSHPPIVYPAALVTGAGPAASAFLDHLAGPAAAARFAELGFSPPPRAE